MHPLSYPISHRISYLLLSLILALAAFPASAIPDLSGLDDDTDSEFLSVDLAFAPTIEADAGGWRVHFDIADHYYLYRDRMQAKNPADELSFVQTAELKRDKNFGDVMVFHDEVDVLVRRGGEGASLIIYQGCSEDGLCYPPQTLFLGPQGKAGARGESVVESVTASAAGSAPETENNSADSDVNLGESGLFWVILSFLGLGIGLSLTPCVFPMIPILSSIIVGQGKDISPARGGSLALSYVVGMASSYALIGVLVSAFGASFNLASLTQTPLVIGVSAALFIFLSLPMFGLFELQLPAGLRNRLNTMQSQQQGGALFSTYAMGFFAALVVSPCVSAPLAGALVYLSSTGDVLTGGTALFALGLGMGAPLILVGMSGGKLLPKAGQWMMMIKSAFGVGLLAVAIGLLDRILPGSVILLLSGALAVGVGVFLGAFDAADSTKARVSRTLGILALVTGVSWWVGAASGSDSLLRPLATTMPAGMSTAMNKAMMADAGVGRSAVQRVEDRAGLEAAIAESDKPVLVDIYADWCTSCRDMDEFLHAPEQADILAGYTLVKFDITQGLKEQQALLSEWQVFGPPALVRFDVHGNREGKALQGLPSMKSFRRWHSSD
jgi:thiol:disulfide interchange protein DsbD